MDVQGYPSEGLHQEQLAPDTMTLQLLMDGLVVEFVRTELNIRGGGRSRRLGRCLNQGAG